MPLDISMPWLRTTSPIESLSSGASAGASAARLEQESTNESARLGMEARRLNQQAAFESARLSQAAEQSQMEFQARQKLAEQNQLREQQRLNIENAYKTAALGIAKGRLEETQRAADEKAKNATLAFQREQAFARDVAGGVPVMEAYRRNPVSSALLTSVGRTQVKEDQSEKPVIREGKYDLVRVNPKTGEAEVVYHAKKKDGEDEIMGSANPNIPQPQKPGLLQRIFGGSSSKPSPQESKFEHPKIGEIRFGHRFKGGDPNDEKNWESVKQGE